MSNQGAQGPSVRGRIATTMTEVSAERRWFTMMRLAFAGVGAAWLLLVVWAIPNGPIADMVPDYSASAVLGLLFALAAVGGSLAFMVLWRPAFKNEAFFDFLHVLTGSGLLLRRRSQFASRLDLECRRAREDEVSVFSLVVVKLDKESLAKDRQTNRRFDGKLAPLWARSVARADDVVGEAADDELWIMARGAGADGRAIVTARMSAQLLSADTLPSFEGAKLGAATFGDDGTDRQALLRAATARLARPGERPEAAAA